MNFITLSHPLYIVREEPRNRQWGRDHPLLGYRVVLPSTAVRLRV